MNQHNNNYIPTNYATNEIAAALCKAQAQMKGALADSTNPHFKSKYADLASIWDACRAPLTDNGLSVVQTTYLGGKDCETLLLKTVLLHSSGQSIAGEMPVLARDNSAQAMGSGLSYARRYALAAMVGVYQTDDDGHAAQAEPRHIEKTVSKPVLTAAAGPVKNMTPITPGQQNELYELMDQKKLTIDEFNKRMHAKYPDVKTTSDLKMWQFEVIKKSLQDIK